MFQSGEFWTKVAVYSTIMAGVIGEMTPPFSSYDELIKTPITLALIALAGFAIWISAKNYEKLVDKITDSQNKVGESIKKLAEELHERPCIRRKDND